MPVSGNFRSVLIPSNILGN